MDDTNSGSWWPQFGAKGETPQTGERSNQALQAKLSESTPRTTSLWSWNNNDPPVKIDPANSNESASEELNAEEQAWWWKRMFGAALDNSPSQAVNKDPLPCPGHVKEDTGPGWFLWFSLQTDKSNDVESDVEDQSTAKLYREAKQALETSRDSCHYAISGHYARTDVELSVAGTSSETRPVKYNYKKKPTIAHEYLESAMNNTKSTKTNSPPLANISDQKGEQGSRNISGTRKVLNSSTQAQLQSISQNTPEARSSNSSIRSVYSGIEQKNYSGVLPELSENFRVITLSTKLRLFGEAMLYGEKTSEKHLYTSTMRSIDSKRKRLAKVVVISLHSFLPTKFAKLILGQSTGSALKFSKLALDAINGWLDENTLKLGHMRVISLEGFGTINCRVEKSYELLKNWVEDINEADFVFFVANSVASPALILLAHKVIHSEIFSLSQKKVGLLSIAGANLGPYAGLDAKVVIRAYNQSENEIINELFELQKSTSNLSTSIRDAINVLCSNNVKITLAGSVNDQFIPLCSSLQQHVRHPNIYRCIHVDENSEVPLFIIKLISIVLTMENVGHNDHNLLSFLLELTQGAVQMNGAHGKIHGDPSIYQAGVRFALETTSVRHNRDATDQITNMTVGDVERSLYHLPWYVRGLLNDLMHIKHVHNLTLLESLRAQYLAWEPTTRHWKSVKHCFAAFEELTIDDILM